MAATLHDILRRFTKRGTSWEKLPEKISLYLLEMHHAIGILELLRLLVDEHGLTFHQAFILTQRCFNLQA